MATRKAGLSVVGASGKAGDRIKAGRATETGYLVRVAGRGARKTTGGRLVEIAHGSPADWQWRTRELLGGDAVIGTADPTDPFSAHEIIALGLPNKAVDRLASRLTVMEDESFEQAIGISARTLQRWAKSPSQKLSQEQSGRVWKFAELLAKAAAVLGSLAEAEQWFERPAIGLNQQRPIDLLSTPAGIGLLEDYLGRLAHGVYT